MEKFSGRVYPNGKPKITLLESYLSCRDIGCHPDDYLFDLEMVRTGSIKGIDRCHWYKDDLGRLLVDQIYVSRQR